jgi:hypothetical protein
VDCMCRGISIFGLILAGGLAVAAYGQPVGLDSSREDVVAHFGEPEGTVRFGEEEVLSYRSVEVQLRKGYVVKLMRLNDLPLPVKKIATPGKSAPAAIPKATRETLSAESDSSPAASFEKASPQKSGWTPARINGTFLVVSGILVSVGAGIWLLVQAFQIGLGWGLACLLLPVAQIVFVIKHWSEAGKPFLVSLGGAAVAVVGFFIARS